jgi:hypothetical protein
MREGEFIYNLSLLVFRKEENDITKYRESYKGSTIDNFKLLVIA